MPNQVIIYSNGIADFRWQHQIAAAEAKEISIPVRTEYLADILASLTVYGNVTIAQPPTYQPQDHQRKIIDLDTGSVVEDLARQLSGAKVQVETAGKNIDGKIIGIQPEQQPSAGHPVVSNQLVIQTGSGVQKISQSEVVSLQFVEPAIQNEIEKSLTRNIDQMKPNSTAVSLAITTQESKDETNAVVQYTVPSAAWKISYRLLVDENDSNDDMKFLGFAIVDNNTDYDWDDFQVSVVTGEPITFSSDLDEIKTPHREHVNLVRDASLGAVEAESSVDSMMLAAPTLAAAEKPVRLRKARARAFAREEEELLYESKVAEFDSAETQEVGDFCIFHSSGTVSIAANQSAMLPIFDVALDQSKSVLYFNSDNHPDRPFRAIQFVNSTEFPLGRGACTIFEQGAYAGSCVLPATKKNAEALLIHALDTGVKVLPDSKPTKAHRTALQISEGVAVESYHQTDVTHYQINSQHDQPFRMMLDHPRPDKNAEIKIVIKRGDEEKTFAGELLQNCLRLEFDLKAREKLLVAVTESRTRRTRVRLIGKTPDDGKFNLHWLFENLVDVDAELLNDPAVQSALQLQRDRDKKLTEIDKAQSEISRLANRQERLRKNIAAGGQDQQTAKWRNDLAISEDTIVGLEEETIPGLQREQQEIQKQLFEALYQLSMQWQQTK